VRLILREGCVGCHQGSVNLVRCRAVGDRQKNLRGFRTLYLYAPAHATVGDRDHRSQRW
jgi:hypothetical protein